MTIAGTIFQKAFPNFAKKRIWRKEYDRIAAETHAEKLFFMNYGYDPLHKDDSMPLLEVSDENYRCMIQLYHHLLSNVEITGKKILEVGSGRGGGCNYIRRYFSPLSITGIDLSKKAVEKARIDFPEPTITFRQGDACALPFSNDSFDVVINIESSHCYPEVSKFITEVHRVLKENGYFLIADFGSPERMAELERLFSGKHFVIKANTDITENVIASLDKLTIYYSELLTKILQDKKRYNSLINMARVRGTFGYNQFKSRADIYKSYVLAPIKPASDSL